MPENTNDRLSIAAAQQRVRSRDNIARRYTAMSNGEAPVPVPVTQTEPFREFSPDNNDPPQDRSSQENITPQEHNTAPAENSKGLFGIKLPSENTDQLLLMVIIVLLASQGADFILIAALVYILM